MLASPSHVNLSSLLGTVLLFQVILLASAENAPSVGNDGDPCQPSSGAGTEADPYVFEASIDYFVSDTGYYKFKNCDAVRPVLQMKAGSYYKFDQTDLTNWMHPLGFAYYPDGAHKDKDELELGLKPPGSAGSCDTDESCQSPMYYGGADGTTFLGGAAGDGAFGLDVYEPQFKDWAEGLWSENKYSVNLRITDDATAEIFYFCHIHEWMSGKIVITNADGTARTTNGAGAVELYDAVPLSNEDVACGSTPAPHYGDPLGPSHFGADSGACETLHLCGEENEFKQCMEAVDCHMTYNMRTTHGPSHDPVETFMRQMIPHHQNAVNMAKVLLKLDGEGVEDADNELGEDAFVGSMLRAIINGQNMQIMDMYGYLELLAEEREETGFVETYDSECAKALERRDISCHCGVECAMKLIDECNCEPEPPTETGIGTEANPCQPSSGAGTEADPYVFEASIDYFVSDTGYYKFKNCDAVRPVLQMKAGSYYKFDQTDLTNWMHPLGFAYYPDGAHKDKDELELGLKPPGSAGSCDTDESCQSPMYYGGADGTTFLGGAAGDGAFGLDVYEPHFKDWAEGLWSENKYSVNLRITDDATAEIFYFCHIHEWMSGKIVITNADGTARTTNGAGAVELYDAVPLSNEDVACGSTPAPHYGDPLGPSHFGADSGACETLHLCGEENEFKQCMEAVDCHMTYNMRTTHGPSHDPVETFMRQMIPHHQNAVNMAKVLLKVGGQAVSAADSKLGEDAFVGSMLRAIINGQNMQIMDMYGYLEHLAAKRQQTGFVETYDAECAEALRALDAGCSCQAQCQQLFEDSCACALVSPRDHSDPEKIVSFVARLEQTEPEFRANEGAYQRGIAAAANVEAADVKVVSVNTVTSRRGRKLLVTSVDVETEIGADTVSRAEAIALDLTANKISTHLTARGLPAATLTSEPEQKKSTIVPGTSAAPSLAVQWATLVTLLAAARMPRA